MALVLLIRLADVRDAIGFGSFGVLTSYAVADLAALRQPGHDRRWPRGVFVLGFVGCAVLAVTLSPSAVVVGGSVLLTGVVLCADRLRRLRSQEVASTGR